MTDIALDKRAKFAAQLRNAANEMRAEDHNGWPVLCDIVADYLDASPSQVAPANPAQMTDAVRLAVIKAYGESDCDPVPLATLHAFADAALTAAIGAGGQAVAWLGEGDGFKSFTRSEATANKWRKGGIKVTPVSALAQPHPADERVVEALDEGLEILSSLMDNITRHGNYSPESTCMFIDQAGQAFRKARTILTQTEASDA